MVKRIIFAVGVFALLAISCSDINEPQMPTWDVSLVDIPLLRADTLLVSELVEEEEMIFAEGPNSLLNIKVDGETSFEVGDQLTYEGTTTSFNAEIGNFNVDAGAGNQLFFSFTEIFPELTSLDGQSTTVPAKTIPTIEQNYNSFDNFQSATFASGYLKVKIKNSLAITLGASISIELIDNTNGSVIGTMSYGTIRTGEEEEQLLDLAGKTISNDLKFKVTGETLGSEGNSIVIDINSSFEVYVTFEEPIAESANAKIPSQTYSVEDQFEVKSETYTLNYAQIESGQMRFDFNNNFGFPITVNLKIPSIVSIGNDTLSQSMYINAYSNEGFNIDLQNYIIKPINDQVVYSADVQMSPDPNSIININSTDFIKIDVTLNELTFSEVNADVNISVEFPEIDEELMEETPDMLENFNLSNVVFTLVFDNMPGDLDVDIEIISVKSGGETKLPLSFTIAQGIKDSVVLDKNGINGDGSSPTIVDLLNNLPERLKVSGDIQLTGDDVTLRSTEDLEITYNVKVPFQFSLSETSIGDTIALDIEDDTKDMIRDNLVSTSLNGTIENNTALGGYLMLFAGDSTTGVYQEILPSSVGFDAANLNSEGYAISPKETDFSLELTKEKFELLANANSIVLDITLHDLTKGSLSSNDYIIVKNVKFSGTGRVYVRDDDEDEE